MHPAEDWPISRAECFIIPATAKRPREFRGRLFVQRIVGMENCAPSLMPEGQRAVTVLVFV